MLKSAFKLPLLFVLFAAVTSLIPFSTMRAQIRSRMRTAHPAPKKTPAVAAVRQTRNVDGSIPGQIWVGENGRRETTIEIQERSARSPRRKLRREMDREVEEENEIRLNRDHLPQNPDALPGAHWPPRASAANLQREANFSLVTNTPTLSFTAATLADTNAYPPDAMGAVGPEQFVIALNGRIRVFDKNSGEREGIDLDSDHFFDTVRNSALTTDPRVRFDPLSGRWFILMINTTPNNNRIMLAVSDGAIITSASAWTFFQFQQNLPAPEGDAGCFADYPSMGIDRNSIYIGVNKFCNRTFSNTAAFVIRKSSVLGAGPIIVSAFRDLIDGNPLNGANGIFTPVGVDNYDPNAEEGYFIGTEANGFGKLVLRRVRYQGSVPVLSPNLYLDVLPTSNSIAVRHKGNLFPSEGRLDSLDDRLFAAHLRRGSIWTAQNIAIDNSGVAGEQRTRNGTRWYEIDVTGPGAPQLLQAGTLFDPDAVADSYDGLNYWMPTIMPSGQGHALMGFSVAGANEFVNAGVAMRLATDPLGMLRAPVRITNSTSAYNPPNDTGARSGRRRWGDYSFTSLDPCDEMTFWTIQQFCDSTNSYGLRVARIPAPPPAVPAALYPQSLLPGQATAHLMITGLPANGAGYHDPGPGAGCRLRVSISGGVAVKAIQNVTATTIELEVSTVNATPGLKNITITNPDGQSVTGTNVLSIGACSYEISGGPLTFSAGGGSGSMEIKTSGGCGWTGIGSADFIMVNNGSGSGNGAVNFSVAPNSGPARSGRLTIAGRSFEIVQGAGAGCGVILSSVSKQFSAAGGTGSFTISASADCSWIATVSDPFIRIFLAPSGTGNRTITYFVAENQSVAARAGTITINNRKFTITQEAAPYELAIDDGSFETPTGLPQGGSSYRVNRLTPRSYPATLRDVAIYFSLAGGVSVGDPLTVLVGKNADGDSSIDNTVFSEIPAQVQAVGQFNLFRVPEVTITEGDFVIGMRIANTERVQPIAFDTTPPSRGRSYRSLDGKSFTLTENLTVAGNYGIRARLVRPSNLILNEMPLLIDEACLPMNGAIDPGESVTIEFPLRNDGVSPTRNLTATLQPTDGITAIEQMQGYGAIAPGEPAVRRTFTFTANGVCGEERELRLNIRDGETNLGTIRYAFRLGTQSQSTQAFSYQGGTVAIPDGDSRGISIPLTISGVNTRIADLNFLIGGAQCTSAPGANTVGVDHSWIGDLVFRLTSPAGTTVTIINRAGGGGNGGNNFCQTLLDDDAAGGISINNVSSSVAPNTGTFLPSAPLSAFDGENPNGIWTLTVIDDSIGDSGSVRAFSLIIAGFTCCSRPTAGYEADVAPRGSGNDRITATDWVQIGRFVAGLESPANSGEFQRADCAPLATLGDGRIDLADWVQAGRFISGVDTVRAAGGPAAANAGMKLPNTRAMSAFQLESLNDGSLRVSLSARADIAAASFSLRFNPQQWQFRGATSGPGTLIINDQSANEGHLGFVLSLDRGSRFIPRRELVTLHFAPIGASRAGTPDAKFADFPVARDILQ